MTAKENIDVTMRELDRVVEEAARDKGGLISHGVSGA
jgi:hypothetical protein